MSWEVITGDCLDVLRGMEAGSVDAVITDPPYNVGLDYGVTTNDRRADYASWNESWFTQTQRISRGAIAVSVGQANLSQWATIAPPTWWLAWWKPAAMGRCVVGFNNWEPIALYGKPQKVICDVIRATITPDPDLLGHPCPKPLEWAIKQIEMLTKPGDVVLDPFAGSGTTGVAAIETGRHYIGIEINPTYADIARARIAKAEAQAKQLPLMEAA